LQQGGITPVVIAAGGTTVPDAVWSAFGVTQVIEGGADLPGVAERYLHAAGLAWHEAAGLGADWPELALLRRCAFAAATASAHTEVRASVHHVTRAAGGQGAAREFCDVLLAAGGRYASLLENCG
jgi:3-deoxy-D-manno-octulosonate 8-phosphate phosphatase (KDO 8-P phosphatase)